MSYYLIQLAVMQILWISIVNKMLGRVWDPRANGAWLNKLTERNKCFSLIRRARRDGREARGNEEREKREDEKGSHCFFKSSGYDKLELKHQNLVFSSL